MLEKHILSTLMQSSSPSGIIESIQGKMFPEDFSIPAHAKICNLFFEYQISHPANYEVRDFINHLPKELQETADEVYLFSTAENVSGGENVVRLALEIRKNALKRKISMLLEQSETDETVAKQLNEVSNTLKEVEKQLNAL